jgi:hypothetical protein
MGSQRRLVIYVGFDSPSIIRYLGPLTGDIFKAHFKDYYFDENNIHITRERKVVARSTTRNHLE